MPTSVVSGDRIGSTTQLPAGGQSPIPTEAGETQTVPTPEAPPDVAAGDPPEPRLDTLLEVVENDRRRRTIQFLADHTGRVEIGDLAEHLAEQANDCPATGPTSTQRKREYVALYQLHLPKLDEVGIVEYDKNRGTVEPGPHAGRATRFLDRASGDDSAWPWYYLSQTTLAGALAGLGFLWPASMPFTTPALGIVLGMLVLTAVGHLYWTRRAPG